MQKSIQKFFGIFVKEFLSQFLKFLLKYKQDFLKKNVAGVPGSIHPKTFGDITERILGKNPREMVPEEFLEEFP